MRTELLPLWQNGRPLEVVSIPSEWEGQEATLGVVDAEHHRSVWVGFSPTPTRVEHAIRDLARVEVGEIPARYGAWVGSSLRPKAIGGVSDTQRRVGLLHCSSHEPLNLFVLGLARRDAVADLLAARPDLGPACTVGDPIWDEGAWAVEVVLHDGAHLDSVAAALAELGGELLLDEASQHLESRRALGVERLDRIDAATMREGSADLRDTDGQYGPRRGVENWRFEWQPAEWEHPAITWDNLELNVRDTPLPQLPYPLRQRAAAGRLLRGAFAELGRAWRRTHAPTAEERRADPAAPGVGAGRGHVRPDAPAEVVEYLGQRADEAGVVLLPPELFAVSGRWCADGAHVRAAGGAWFRVVDEERALRAEAHGLDRRTKISPRLSRPQSRQLLSAFYVACIARTPDPVRMLAARLVLYHYLVQRGYTARFLGKYDQRGCFVGNGSRLRKFKRLQQYDIQRLPSAVLNRFLEREGSHDGATIEKRVRVKGSRSKYKSKAARAGSEPYVPVKRMRRSQEAERSMLQAPSDRR